MQHSQIIADLGGYMAVAAALKTPPNIVWRWGQTRAIPARRWPAIVELAKRKRLRHITAAALLAGYEPAQQQAAADAARMREGSGARAAA
jgi:hypothetical protein